MEQHIKDILVDVCGSEQVLEDGVDLLDSGFLDSLAFISLLMALEDEGIDIQPTQVDRNCFRTVEGIIDLVKKLQ
ncbi:MAG: phosphopantetheine-binding protein [Negativibacillus sp.]